MPRIILGIPGKWPTRSDIVRAIAEFSGGYLFAGAILMKTSAPKLHWEVDVHDHFPKLRRAFEIAGQGLIDNGTLDSIAEHTHTLYVMSEDVGLEAAQGIAEAASALLDAGGLAVKVESSGTAHDAKTWRALAAAPDAANLYRALVVLVGKNVDDNFYSCGMHHFALPDTTLPASVDPEEAAVVMNRFNQYQLIENPTFKSGHTFSIAPDAPRYRLEHRPCTQFAPDDPFHNPAGYWHLAPI